MGVFTSLISSLQYMHNIYDSTKPCYACCFWFFCSKSILISTAKLNLPVHILRLTMKLARNKALRISCAIKKDLTYLKSREGF